VSAPRAAVRELRRLTRSPLVHFALLGGLLLAARHPMLTREDTARAPVVRAPIVIPPERVRALGEAFTARWGGPPSAAQLRALVEQTVQEEMLFREARLLALGLGDGSARRRLVEKMRLVSDRPGRSEDDLAREATELGLDDDVVIRRLLVEKMRLVLRQEAGGTPIADHDLAAHLERHRDVFEQPERITFTQVFLGEDAHGTQLAADARRTLARLRSSGAPAERVAELSDPFPLGARLRAYTRSQLVGRFGTRFAEKVLALEPGAWSEPLASPYGLHLVRVEEKLPARLPSIDEVRPALTRAVMRERARQNLARGLTRLRQLYAVRVEDGGLHAAGVPLTDGAS
jgi:hypothetical protein